MPKNKMALLRMLIIDKAIRNSKTLNVMSLVKIVEQKLGYSCSTRTIQQDLFDMKEDFDAPIKFNRTHMGYYYSDKDYTLLKAFENI